MRFTEYLNESYTKNELNENENISLQLKYTIEDIKDAVKNINEPDVFLINLSDIIISILFNYTKILNDNKNNPEFSKIYKKHYNSIRECFTILNKIKSDLESIKFSVTNPV